jgi:hypothetical protein
MAADIDGKKFRYILTGVLVVMIAYYSYTILRVFLR